MAALIAALALVAGRRQLTNAYRLDLIPTWWSGALAHQPLTTAVYVGDDIVDVTTDQQE